MKRLFFLAAMLCSVSPGMGQYQSVVTGDQGNGNIDWSARIITVTGVCAPNPQLPQTAQKSAAQRDAQRLMLLNALETIKEINLNSSISVNGLMLQNSAIVSSVNGFVKGLEKKGSARFLKNGSVETMMEIPIDGVGEIGDLLIGNSISENPAITQFEGKKAGTEVVFTGLIINCKGLSVKPALSPRVMDESGQVIYGGAYISREWAIKNGIAGYSKTMENAVKLVDRIGTNPGKIKAQKVHGEKRTDVVISNKSAADVRSTSANLKFLSECRVVLIID